MTHPRVERGASTLSLAASTTERGRAPCTAEIYYAEQYKQKHARNSCPAPESNEALSAHLIFSKCAPYTGGPDFPTDKVGQVPMNEQKFNGAKRNLNCCEHMSRPRVERGPSAYIVHLGTKIHCWCTVHRRTLSTVRASPVYLQDLNRLLVYSTFLMDYPKLSHQNKKS
jgi:hypothetical protein